MTFCLVSLEMFFLLLARAMAVVVEREGIEGEGH
jgi:hypothetical protein